MVEQVEYNLNADGSCMTAAQIVDDIIANRMDRDTLDHFKNLDESELITQHTDLGMWIRNSYGLWAESNPHTSPEDSDGPKHPDQYSFQAIKLLHRKLNEVYPRDQVKS